MKTDLDEDWFTWRLIYMKTDLHEDWFTWRLIYMKTDLHFWSYVAEFF